MSKNRVVIVGMGFAGVNAVDPVVMAAVACDTAT
jgi:NADH dehydrogenase FAD-containing subunit